MTRIDEIRSRSGCRTSGMDMSYRGQVTWCVEHDRDMNECTINSLLSELERKDKALRPFVAVAEDYLRSIIQRQADLIVEIEGKMCIGQIRAAIARFRAEVQS